VAIEITAAALAKTLAPTINTIFKEAARILVAEKLKWDAAASIRNMTKIILNINTVKTMWSRDRGVAIGDFYYPPRLKKKNSRSKLQSIEEVIRGKSVIEGIVGQGKSIFMRNLCNEIVSIGDIPIFLELRMISNDRPLVDLIMDYMDSAGIRGGKEMFDFLARDGRITLVLDGFDEIPENMVTSTIYMLQHYQKKYAEMPVVVSSRPHHAVQRLAGFQNFEIDEFEEDDYKPFLRKLIDDVILRENIHQSILDAPENIRGVITTPLMLTLLCLVYEMESEIPSTLPDFFNSLFSAVFSKHDRFKPGFQRERQSGLTESKLQHLFDAFCFMVVQLEIGRTMQIAEFQLAFTEALEYTGGISCELEGFKNDIVKVACLMLEDGFEQISFLHKSILEYHAASFIKNSSAETAAEFYRIAANDLTAWEQVLEFLKYVDEFRYGKYYVLRYYPAELEEISQVIKSQDADEFLRYINTKIPGFLLRMAGTKISGYTFETIRPMFKFHNSLIDMMEDITEAAVEAASEISIFTAIRSTKASDVGSLGIDLPSVFTHLNPQNFFSALVIIENKVKSEIAQFEKLMGSERKKFDMLQPVSRIRH